MSTRILLVDDHKIMIEGLRVLISNQADMEVVGEAENGRQAVELAMELKPDIIIMDLSMPDLNGIEAIGKIKAGFPDIKSLALSMHSDKRYVSRALSEGAAGYMLKHCAFEELIDAIKAIISGKRYLSPQLLGLVVDDYVSYVAKDESSVISFLTAREREVLQLLAEGFSIKEMSYMMKVSVKTVEAYRSQLMVKLGVQGVAELTKIAIREGLTSLED